MQSEPSIVHEEPYADGHYPDGTIYHEGHHGHVPLDGQVVLEPLHDAGCDALPMGHCGCGQAGCDGACGVACDGCGPSCPTGGCNGDPLCGEYRDCDNLEACVTICLPQDGWISAEYLLWWQDGMALPPLASTGPLPSAANPANTGTLLYGGDDVLTDSFDGFRFDFGFWLDRCHTWGIGADFFRLAEETDGFFGDPTTFPALARPFLNANLGAIEDSELVNSAGVINGTLNIDVDSELYGWGVHFKHLRCAQEGCTTDWCGCPDAFCSRTEYLIGFRQVQLGEGVRIEEQLTTPTAPIVGFGIFDDFRTRNQFNGLDVGWAYKRTRGYWTAEAKIRLAVGNTRQRVRINGATTITPTPGTAQTGGLLAQASNIGSYDRDEFTILPQLDLRLGYQLTDQWRATIGYTFLYWSNVVRPGDHIDRLVDVNQLPSDPPVATPAADFPRFTFDNTDYWAQGLSFGAEYRW